MLSAVLPSPSCLGATHSDMGRELPRIKQCNHCVTWEIIDRHVWYNCSIRHLIKVHQASSVHAGCCNGSPQPDTIRIGRAGTAAPTGVLRSHRTSSSRSCPCAHRNGRTGGHNHSTQRQWSNRHSDHDPRTRSPSYAHSWYTPCRGIRPQTRCIGRRSEAGSRPSVVSQFEDHFILGTAHVR